MSRYVFDGQTFVSRDTGKPISIPERDGLCLPAHFSDIEPYQSPIDGAYVSGRAGRRYDMEKNNCVDANELPRAKGRTSDGKFKNKRFAKKHNLPLSEEVL